LILSAVPSTVLAQAESARVLPPGMVRIHAGGISLFADSRFGPPLSGSGASREPLSTRFTTVLADSTFTPFRTLQQNLNGLLAATDSLGPEFRAASDNLFAPVTDVRASVDTRIVPVGVEVGVIRRVSVGVGVPFVNTRLQTRRLGVDGGTIGINPDPAANRILFDTLGARLGVNTTALGRSAFLPLAGSALGQALQQKVRAASGGQELRLPVSPLAAVGLEGFRDAGQLGTGRFDPRESQWQLGDATLSAKVEFLNTGPGFPYPAEEANFAYRGSVEAGVRLPTGTRPDAGYLVLPLPEQGLGGAFVHLYNDVFISRRLWATAGARWERLQGIDLERRTQLLESEFIAETLRWEPGTRVALHISPRFRLIDELTVLGGYRYLRRMDESLGVQGSAPAAQAVTGTAQQWIIGAEFSTLAAYLAGRSPVPVEASIALRETFAGSSGAAAERAVEVRAALYQWLWGRR
jgi:hypothetical protein